MKPFITGIALFILLIFMVVFQSDNLNCRLETENLKYCCDEAANSAALICYTDSEIRSLNYLNGEKIFNELEAIKTIEYIIQNYLKTDAELIPLNTSYWTEKINYTVYFFDDDLKCSVYTNGTKVDEFEFTYPYLFKDKDLQYLKSVGKANVIVTINAGHGRYRLSFIDSPIIIRSSGYEYQF